MKNYIIAVLGLAVVGLGAYVVVLQQDHEPESLGDPEIPQAPVAQLAETSPAKPAVPDPAVKDPEPAEPQPTIDQLKKANNLIGALYQANQALEEETEPSLARGIKQIVESPELKRVIRQGVGDRLKQSHASLFRRMGLGPDQEAAMMDLLIEQNIAGIETGVQWMTGNHTESSAQIIAAREKLYDDVLQQFGPEALAEVQYWDVTKNERESMSKFNRRLGDAALDAETSDWMVDMMYETRGEFEEIDYLSQPENFDPREMTPEYRADVMGQVETLHGRYLEEAAPALSEDQLSRYEGNLARERRELEGFLKFSHDMFNRRQQGAE